MRKRWSIFGHLLLLFAGMGFGHTAHAADVAVIDWRGHKVLKLTGPIDDGTEESLTARLDQVQALPYGLPVLLLDSPGGLIEEALKISALLDRRPAHTIVPNGAKCASACASIIFLAGKARTIEDGGLLGQHSCSRGGAPDETCNEKLSDRAVAHGVSHGSVKAFACFGNLWQGQPRVMSIAKSHADHEAINPPAGKTFKCDLEQLINEIRIAPTAPAWFEEAVREFCGIAGIQKPIIKSDLTHSPMR